MSDTDHSDEITELLHAWGRGHDEALDLLVPQVARELHSIARRHLAGERPDPLLQPGVLINELWLSLLRRRRVQWVNPSQFYAFASKAMRRILIDHARARQSMKRGAAAQHVPLHVALGTPRPRDTQWVALHDALHGLAEAAPALARLVELRYFVGLTLDETAEVLGISTPTVSRQWVQARRWLRETLRVESAERF